MNRRQKLVQQEFLNNEAGVIRRLDQVYTHALNDVNGNIKRLMERFDPETGDLPQSAIYQLKYQNMLKAQLEGTLQHMHTQQFSTVSDYLDGCYTDGFIGNIFDLHGQDVPMVMPIDQEAMVRAVQLDSPISQGLYTRLGEDVAVLKRKITAQVSRSIATGTSFADCARQLAGYTRIGYNNAIRIARTEGHRIQNTAIMDSMDAAVERGADLVKQWDATLDGRTRESHVAVDGEIREKDEKFSNGLMYPGDPAGGAAEVINCRCRLNQRARWALDDGSFTKWNNFTGQLETFDSPQSYAEFKEAFFSDENVRYMNYVQQMQDKYHTLDFTNMLDSMTDREYNTYSTLLRDNPLYNKAAEVITPARPTFVPATTIEEAEAYADRFVESYKDKYSGVVDYHGIDLQYANEMNRAYTDVFAEYEPDFPLGNIKPMNMREKRFSGTTAEAAYQWGNRNMFYNRGYYKTQKAFAAHCADYDNMLAQVLPNIDVIIAKYADDMSFSGRAKYRYASAFKATGRTNVSRPDAYGTTIHEMGHYLDDRIFGKVYRASGFDLGASYTQYSGGISAYATTDQREYVAESFAAYWVGEIDILDPELVKIFEGARK